jgi:hypothetical protein
VRSRLIAILCVAAALAAGTTSASARTHHPHTVTAPTASNQTVRLHVGDRLKVHLGTAYRRPHSSRPRVLQRLRYSGGYPTGDDARATFKAVAAGHADVSSMTDAPCLHTTPRCEIAQQLWVVHVVVKP